MVPYLLFSMDWEHQGLIKSLQEVFDRTCSICHENYDLKTHIPMMLCLSQHMCCQICVLKHMALFEENICKCPICNVKINKSDVMKVRRFDAIIELYEKNEHICKEKAEERYQKFKAELKANINSHNNRRWLYELEEKENQISSFYSFMLEQATKLFRDGSITKATEILQQILMKFPDRNDKFDGLGSKDEAQGYYGNVQSWFQRVYGNKIISAFDLLGLCFLVKQNQTTTKAQKSFYLELSKRFPADYRIWFGLALVEHNNQKYREAESLYWKVTKMQPDFDKPYQMIAFIQLYHKSNYEEAIKMAEQALLRNPKNIFAHYILAVCFSNRQQKLMHLNSALEIDKLYGRAKHLLGILIIQMHQDHKSAQTYFQQCLKIDPKYNKARLNLVQSLIANKDYKQAMRHLKYLNERKAISKQICNYIIRAFEKAGQNKHAIQFLIDTGLEFNQTLGDLHFKEGNHYAALQYFEDVKNIDSKDESCRIAIKMGDCYSKLKWHDEAEKYYQKALRIIDNQEGLREKTAMMESLEKQAKKKMPGMIRSNTASKMSRKASFSSSDSQYSDSFQ